MSNDESFMKSLFGGVVADTFVFPYPELGRADADQVLVLLEQMRRFSTRQVDSARIDEDEAIPRETLRALGELGAFGLRVPKDLGGAGLGATGAARVVQELATVDASLALTVNAHTLAVEALLLFASDELKERLLPKIGRGELTCAFALAEVGAGSDAASIRTRADRAEDGTFVIEGEKAWVTNGAFADALVVFARTSPAEDGAKPKLTAFLVERGPGVTSGREEPKLGVTGASTTSVKLSGVRVPPSHVLGELGRGFKVAMEALTRARLTLAGTCVGMSKRMLRASVERVGQRKAFGRTIAEFGLVRDKIARMTAEVFALESMTYLTTGLADGGATDFSVESAICKVFGSEALWFVANETAQIAGAAGYMREFPYERMLRDARLPMVYEGTNEILRCFIALSGMQGPGRELEEVSKAMREPIKGFGLLSDFALRKARSALGRERLSRAHPALAREAVLFEEYTGHLAKSVDKVLRRHGQNIAEMQYTQKRVADVAIDLYAIASVVSRASRAIERRGEEGARREIDLATVFVASAKRRLFENVASFDENDDELRKAVSQKTCADAGYPLDIV